MDQKKIGKFIADCRKEKGLTQVQLAEIMGVSDRAVSKWETGKSMPDCSIMLQLCETLDISVNELLTGKRIPGDGYKKAAEENLLQLAEMERTGNQRLLELENVIVALSIAALVFLVIAAMAAVENPAWQLCMVLFGAALVIIAAVYAVKIEHDAGYYECPSCGIRYVPSMTAVVTAAHRGKDRYMKCPYCGKRGLHKKVLTK